MGWKNKPENKSDILHDIIEPFDFETTRRNRLAKAHLVTVYGFLRGGKNNPDRMSMDELRESLVTLCYTLHDAETGPPDDATRYTEADYATAAPGLSRKHALVVRDVVVDTIEDQTEAIEARGGR